MEEAVPEWDLEQERQELQPQEQEPEQERAQEQPLAWNDRTWSALSCPW